MIKFKNAVLCAALAVSAISSLFSQNESVILYNSQPVKVELSQEGKIQSFVGLAMGYMDGFLLDGKNPTVAAPLEIEEPAQPVTTKNAGYAVVSNESIQLSYKPNFAILDKSIISELNEVAAKLKIDPNSKILLTAHSLTNKKDKLTSNRLASAIAYLGIKGIHPDRIQSEVQKNEGLINVIAINYLY